VKGEIIMKNVKQEDIRLVRRGRGWVPVYWSDRHHQWQVDLNNGGSYVSPSWDDIEEMARCWGSQIRDDEDRIISSRKTVDEYISEKLEESRQIRDWMWKNKDYLSVVR